MNLFLVGGFDYFTDQLVNGLNTGSIYALVAIGYTMVYGIIRLINFAHGEIMMFGAYFAYYLITMPIFGTLPFLVVILLSMILAALLGMSIEYIGYRKLRKATRISALITAIGMSLFLQNLAQIIFGSDFKRMPVSISTEPINILGKSVAPLTVYTVVLTVIFMVLLSLFVKFTKAGTAMRAVSMDKDAARLMGINIDKTITLTFAIGSALGALGGIFYTMAFSQVYPTVGMMPGLKAFIAAVFGGIGSISGAMIGGYFIGIFEVMTKAYISKELADAIVFSVLIFILLFKPTGLLGKNLKEKV